MQPSRSRLGAAATLSRLPLQHGIVARVHSLVNRVSPLAFHYKGQNNAAQYGRSQIAQEDPKRDFAD